MNVTAEQIAERFASFDYRTALVENWDQGPTTLAWALTDHVTIQGIICTIDRDTTISWLLMIVDTEQGIPNWVVSYLAVTYGGPHAWIEADDDLTACRRFIDWLETQGEQ